jgi:hypothetical protein
LPEGPNFKGFLALKLVKLRIHCGHFKRYSPTPFVPKFFAWLEAICGGHFQLVLAPARSPERLSFCSFLLVAAFIELSVIEARAFPGDWLEAN